MRREIVAVVWLASAACALDSAGPNAAAARLTSISIAESPSNSLAAVVAFNSQNADSARLIYRELSPGAHPVPGSEHSSPFTPIQNGGATIAALGLHENTTYGITLEAKGRGGDTAAAMSFRTGPLQPDLAGLRLQPSAPVSSRYALTDFTTASAAYIVAFDETGKLCWYRRFRTEPGEVAIDAEQQSNGNYILFVGVSTGWQPTPGRFFEVTPLGDSVRTYEASAPYYTDPHELILDRNGNDVTRIHILGYDLRHVDLTSIGGKQDQLVAGHVILRQSVAGAVEFAWNAWDHFSIADWIFIQPGLSQFPTIDFDHPNSLTKDADGNYIVSFASLGEITKINASTGEFIWRLGGRNNQFTFVGDPLNGFGIQHHVRVLPTGNLLLIDNGVRHTPPETRAVEYKLDLIAHTATMVWQYRHAPPIFAPFAGSAQRLKNGNTFVAFGAAAQVAEVAPNGQVVWEAQMTNNGAKVPFFYRVRQLGSLYKVEER